jgi:hypothetical protein
LGWEVKLLEGQTQPMDLVPALLFRTDLSDWTTSIRSTYPDSRNPNLRIENMVYRYKYTETEMRRSSSDGIVVAGLTRRRGGGADVSACSGSSRLYRLRNVL